MNVDSATTVKSQVFIAWKSGSPKEGAFTIRNGKIDLIVNHGNTVVDGNAVEFSGCVGDAPACVELILELSGSRYGKKTSVIHWTSEEGSFSFLPSSISENECIQIPDLGVVIGQTPQALESENVKNTSYDEALSNGDLPRGREIGWNTWAARNNRPLDVPTALGLSRDQRMFIIDPVNDTLTASLDIEFSLIGYILARASTPEKPCVRTLDEGYLPILHTRQKLGGILIEDTIFASLIDRPLTEENIAGTPLNIGLLYCKTCSFPEGQEEVARNQAATTEAKGEIVLFVRTRLTNCSDISLLAPQHLPKATKINQSTKPLEFNAMVDIGATPRLDEDGVAWTRDIPFSRHRVDGTTPTSLQPCPILKPGETMTIDSILSHRREGLSEAARNGNIPWDEKLAETRAFWQAKLRPAAEISVPENRLTDFWKAGLLHLELVTFGEKGNTALLPKVGCYTSIGSESIPIVEFYDSVGLHDTARRCVDSFFEFQWHNGRINHFSHYDIETGGALFMAGRHFLYTRDKDWVRARTRNLKQAADYLLGMRQLDDREAPNYGLMLGTCADPVEATTSFMLNAYGAAGLLAVAEMLEAIADADAPKYRVLAGEFACLYREAFAQSFTKGPVIQTAPGRWVPTCSPSVEGIGLEMMGLKGESGFTHRTYAAFDALLGPLYGVFTGLIGFKEKPAQWLLELNHAQFNRAGITESQPYYGRHPEIHLMRGEREMFLNAFYSGLTALADRDTFTFWEHLFQVSIHKTHEEGWALMQLRRMLWLESNDELQLLAGIPEEWLDRGKVIEIKGGGSYFGDLSFRIERSGDYSLDFCWEPKFHTPPQKLRLHLPGLSLEETQEERVIVHSADWIEILDSTSSLTVKLRLK